MFLNLDEHSTTVFHCIVHDQALYATALSGYAA